MNPGSDVVLISDVHSNIVALREIFRHIRPREIYHAGDIVGYNPYPLETISLFKEYHIKTIRGNHDRSVLTGEYSEMNEFAAMAIEWTMQHIGDYGIDFLRSLKSSMRLNVFGRRVAIYHGSPRNEDEYIYEEDISEDIIPRDVDVLILGHTHIPYIKRFDEKLVINPGSVGQPRDGDPRASCVVVDENWNARIVRIEYDVNEVYRKIKEVGLPEFLGTRLFRGI